MKSKKQDLILKYVPIGISDFAELIENNYYFVDKSLFIKELLDSRAKVTLLPRPRRFGKTLNISMVRYFFEKVDPSRRHLFKGLKIENYPECMAHQGQYPVIFLTFKDVKHKTWDLCYENIKVVIAREFKRHDYLLSGFTLNDFQKEEFIQIIEKNAPEILYRTALLNLSKHLTDYHQKRPLILIDEYDAAIHEGFLNGYYNNVIDFMRSFLCSGLKDNSHLELSILTGILRIAKESIFSGLNNLEVRTFLSNQYASQFGLLEEEVVEALTHFGLNNHIDQVRHWYDGYQSGPNKLYNPWSIVNLIKNDGIQQPYWVNTSDNALIKKLLQQSGSAVKEDLEVIIQGKAVTKEINENVVMPEILISDNALWNFLLMSGYLTFENYRPDPRLEGSWLADLKTPNSEVAFVYITQINSWFEASSHGLQMYQKMLQNLIAGNIEEFCELFVNFTTETLSAFDATGKNPEKFYHGLALGMFSSLRDSHEIKSNRESSWGRYDVMIIPKNIQQPGIVIEFKTASKMKKESLKAAAQNALDQINEKQYETEFKARGIKTLSSLVLDLVEKDSCNKREISLTLKSQHLSGVESSIDFTHPFSVPFKLRKQKTG